MDRLLDLYEAGRTPGESATAFFGRVPVEDVKRALRDLGEIDLQTATPEDFVDLGEDHAFKASTLEGECAA